MELIKDTMRKSLNGYQYQGRMTHFCLFLMLILLTGCKTSDVPMDNIDDQDELNIEIECITNAMPMSGGGTGGSYVIVTATPTDSLVQENLKIIELVATGENGTWTADLYDNSEYTGKGLKYYRNIARGFTPSIGSNCDFKLVIQFELGKTKTFEINDVSMQVVY